MGRQACDLLTPLTFNNHRYKNDNAILQLSTTSCYGQEADARVGIQLMVGHCFYPC